MAEQLDVEFVRWSIDARNAIQSALLNLAVCYQTPINPLKAGDNGKKFCELAGIAFSLWRAAFLSSMASRPYLSQRVQKEDEWTNEETASYTKHASELLNTILQTNAVSFTDDRRTQFWMGQYYIDNAAYRLDAYLKRWPEEAGPDTANFTTYWSNPAVDSHDAASAFAWMAIFESFVWLVSRLLAALKLEAVKPMQPIYPFDYKFVPRQATMDDFLSAAAAQVL